MFREVLLLLALPFVSYGGVSFGFRTSWTHTRADERQVAIRNEVQYGARTELPEVITVLGMPFARCSPGTCPTKRYISCVAEGVTSTRAYIGSDSRYNRKVSHTDTYRVYWAVPDGLGDTRGFPHPRRTWADYSSRRVTPRSVHPDMVCQSDGTLTTGARF